MREERPPLNRLFQFYILIFREHPLLLLLFVVAYLIIVTFVFWGQRIVTLLQAPQQVEHLQLRTIELQTQLEAQKKVLERLSQTTREPTIFRELQFTEQWKTDQARIQVTRLLEYADFAISKEDYQHAEKLYREAGEIQPTVSVPYYQGRLNYMQGDLEAAKSKWTEAIQADPEMKYPELRFYLGLIHYELNEDDESKELLRLYLQRTRK